MLPLKQGIIYGPVNSRRLGRSLGINLLPGWGKVCSFDCIYCQSGNGEATLHPRWPEIVENVRQLRDRYRPAARLTLLSNSSTAVRPEVRATLARLDAPIMKLDAGDEATFAALNRPADGVSLDAIVAALVQVPGLRIQSLMVQGAVTNSEGPAFENWLAVLARLKPVQVQVYSTDRPVPEAGVERVPPERLQQIAARAAEQTGLDVRAYWTVVRNPSQTAGCRPVRIESASDPR